MYICRVSLIDMYKEYNPPKGEKLPVFRVIFEGEYKPRAYLRTPGRKVKALIAWRIRRQSNNNFEIEHCCTESV